MDVKEGSARLRRLRRVQRVYESPKAIRLQILIYLLFSRIHHLVSNSYGKQFRLKSHANDSGNRRKLPAGMKRLQEFPRAHWFWYWFESASNTWLLVILLKNTLPGLCISCATSLMGLLDQPLAMPADCYVPGRLVMHESVRHEMAGSIAFMNLCFRFINKILARPLRFTLLDFLLQDRADLDDFRGLMARGGQQQQQQLPLVYQAHAYTCFMCYPVKLCEQVGKRHWRELNYFKLKPNRTREARRALTKRLALATLAVTAAFLGMATVLVPLVGGFLLLDRGYLAQYPGCDARLGRAHEAGQLSLLSITLTRHRLIVLLFDSLDNFFIWFESGASITYVFALPYLLNYDLLYYWHQLHAKVCAQLKRMRRAHASKRGPPPELELPAGQGWPAGLGMMAGTHLRARVGLLARATHEDGKRPIALVEPGNRTRDLELNELRWQLADFFFQLSQVDLLVSDFVSTGFAFWLLAVTINCNAAIGYYTTHPHFLDWLGLSFSEFLVYGLSLASIPTTIISFALFQINSKCSRSYQLLCSLVAHHQTSRLRERLSAEIMDNFVHQYRIAYRLLQMYPFKATSYLSLAAWTVSSLTILLSLVKRHEA